MRNFLGFGAVVCVLVFGLSIASPAQAQKDDWLKGSNDKRWERIRLTPIDDLANRVSVIDDPMEIVATLSTEPIYQHRQGLLSLVPSDVYLRAFVVKKTGEVSYQYVLAGSYYGSYETIRRATYQTSDGPEPADVRQLRHDIGPCTATLGCRQSFAVAIDVPEDVIQWASTRPRTDNGNWTLRFGASTGDAGNFYMSSSEVAALLLAVDRYKAISRLVSE